MTLRGVNEYVTVRPHFRLNSNNDKELQKNGHLQAFAGIYKAA